jgi:mannose-1-phosphate guanylyltransferase
MNYALIMAGGAGTRLWPLSREKKPKQALSLIGNRTMFQHAVDRVLPDFPPEQIIVVTSAEHVKILQDQASQIPVDNFIIEPEAKGTAHAIGLAAVHLQAKDPEGTMVVLTADHYITDVPAFRKALQAAIEAANQGYLVTLGIKPTEPSSAYGYIQRGALLDEYAQQSIYHVRRFVEKPDRDTAKAYLDSGEYSWNSGMFIWQVSTIMQEFERQMPVLYGHLEQLAPYIGTTQYDRAVISFWGGLSKQTIDYGIMEKALRIAVLPAEFGWMDIGSWGSLCAVLSGDDQGNTINADTVCLDVKNTLIFGSKKFVAAIGVKDLIIVDTEDALLICHKDNEQDVRKLVEILKQQKRDLLL